MTKLKDYPSGTVEAGVKLAGVNGVGDVQLYDATTFVGPVGPESQVPGPQGAVGPALTPNEHAVFNEAKVTAIQTADIDWVIVVDNDKRSNQSLPASIAGNMTGHMLKFRTSDNAWLDLGQWRGPQGIEGPPGPAGGGLVPDGYGILNAAKISAVQTAGVNYIYVVDPLGDTRTDKNTPAGIVGDMERHIIRYDAATNAWKDFGQFTGIQGPRGLQGIPGPASTVPGPESTVPGPAGPAAWGPVQPWANGLECSATAPRTVVTYLGESYVCKVAHTAGPSFNSANFDKIAAKGGAGGPGQGVPAGGTTGQVLAKTSNANYATAWVDGGGGLGAKPINEVSVYQTDFGFTGAIGTQLAGFGFSATVAGTAAAATATMSGGTGRSGSGKVQLKPGSTSSGTSKITHGDATYPYKPGDAAHVAIAGACIPTLSDSSQRIRAFVGCSAAPQLPSGTTYSVGFQYSDNVNGGRWQIIVRDSTGENLHDTGVTVVALAWYHMEIHFNTVGNQVSLVLGGTTFGPYTYTGTEIHGIGAGVAKLLGTIERTLEIDYLSHTVSWVGNRI